LKSLSFDGSDEYLEIADDSSLDITTDITISCWVKVSSFDTAVDGLVYKGDSGGTGYGIYLVQGDDTSVGVAKFHPRLYNSNLAESGNLNIDTWYHIVGTHESGSVDENKIYIDGVLSATVSDDNPMAANNEELQIGRQFLTGNYNLNGNICQVGIWDAVLTQAQIQSIMEKTYAELTASEKEDLVSYWALDVDGSDSHGDNDGTLT